MSNAELIATIADFIMSLIFISFGILCQDVYFILYLVLYYTIRIVQIVGRDYVPFE